APEIVMGLGDYEYFLGYTRGMTQEAFQTIVNKSIHHLAHRIQHLVAQTYGTSLPQEVKQNTNGVIEIAMEASSALPKVRITGMMELAGGKSHWDKRFDLARDEARKIFGETRYQRLAQRTLANRQAMVDHWLTLRGQEITEGARIDEFTSRDLPSYIAFHKMIQELFGNRLIVLAGDSRPMEMFASTYTYNPLISVSGLYAGADFK
ncbi:MAG TPA: hypothetical protein VFQ63_03795, partial [Patescibacteria group bacterium]|nr:hypothetical protein [Patescibacteria group bacterium]